LSCSCSVNGNCIDDHDVAITIIAGLFPNSNSFKRFKNGWESPEYFVNRLYLTALVALLPHLDRAIDC
jgi:hypothetical protein